MDEEFLTAAEASKKLWPINRQACWFFIWYGLLVMPLCCAAGHQWKSFNSNSDKGNLFLHCTERIPNPDFHSDDEDDDVPRKKLCNKKMTWRRPGTLPNYLGNNFKPLVCFRLFLQSGSKTSRSEHEELERLCHQD